MPTPVRPFYLGGRGLNAKNADASANCDTSGVATAAAGTFLLIIQPRPTVDMYKPLQLLPPTQSKPDTGSRSATRAPLGSACGYASGSDAVKLWGHCKLLTSFSTPLFLLRDIQFGRLPAVNFWQKQING